MLGTILAFDIGSKRTGVASGHSLTKSASPAGQLLVRNGQFDWSALDKLIAEWEPVKIVIGDPFTNPVTDKETGLDINKPDPVLKKVINRFKSHIQKNHKLPIIEIDERLSSSAANIEMQDQNLTQAKKTVLRDQIAACLILESYFNSQDT